MIRTRLVASLRWRRRQSLSVGRCVRSAPVLVSFVFHTLFVIIIVNHCCHHSHINIFR